MLEINYAMRCCGVHEINGLSYYQTPQSAMLEFCNGIYPDPAQNHEKYKEAVARATAEGQRPWHPGFTGGQTTYAVYQDVEQYSKFRFAIFTEATKPDFTNDLESMYGRKFAKLIEDEKLGTLVCTGRELNPNSGHNVKVWVWGIDHNALKKWYKKNSKEKPWEQKPMSAVIGNAAPAASPFVQQAPVSGTTIASAGNGITSNAGLPTSGSSRQGNRW